MKTIVKNGKSYLPGSHFIGEVPSYYVRLLTKLFGQPSRNVCDKVQHEWVVSLMDEDKELAVFTIYDYYGEGWHVGGFMEAEKWFPNFKALLHKMVLSVA